MTEVKLQTTQKSQYIANIYRVIYDDYYVYKIEIETPKSKSEIGRARICL
jgi:hypothetical protein